LSFSVHDWSHSIEWTEHNCGASSNWQSIDRWLISLRTDFRQHPEFGNPLALPLE
jgi:hypothetical protein